MKTVKIAASAAAALLATGLFGAAKDAMTGDANVFMTSLSAHQRYPWNGKVDIDFSFTCAVPEAFAFIQFKASYVNANGETVDVPMKTFDQMTLPWCTNAGTYRVTWNSTADAPNLVVTNLRYRVTANMAKYMVIDLSSGKDGASWPISYYEDVPSFPGVEAGKWDDYHKTTNLVLRLVQPGQYTQAWGDWADSSAHYNAHAAVLTCPYYLAVFELTQEQHFLMNGSYGQSSSIFTGGSRKIRPTTETYANVRGSGLSSSDGINWPVTGSDVGPNSLLRRLRDKTGSSLFDLPTESEWEYACRCGGAASGFWNDGSDAGIPTSTKFNTIVNGNAALESLGRYQHNGGMVKTDNGNGACTYTEADKSSDESLGTAVVGSYRPNAWGLYDMHGNVAEWCNGTWGNGTRWSSSVVCTNDAGWVISNWTQYSQRPHRGSKWNSEAYKCAIPYRRNDTETQANGVRLCWRFPTPPQE